MLCGVVFPPVATAEKPFIAILCDHNKDPYKQLALAFIAEITKSDPTIESEIFHLEHSGNDQAKSIKISSRKPLLVLAIGSRAFTFATHQFPKSPLIVTMVVERPTVDKSISCTGVLLTTPPSIHLQWLKRFLPDVRKIGLLYGPQKNSSWLKEARETVPSTEYEIFAEAINKPNDIPKALKKIVRQSETLLSLPNSEIYSRKTAKQILLTTFKNRIPFVGPSRAWVKAGALYALEWDFSDIGRQCADIARDILNGTPTHQIAFKDPVTFGYSLNLKTARHMKLTINPELENNALQIFK